MKNTKKFLSMLLVVLMCLTAVPFGGFDLGTVASAAETVSCTVKYDVGSGSIHFGSYPQSKVTDEATIIALNEKAPNWDKWISYGYYSGTGSIGSMTQGDWMRYTDVIYNGEKYRGVKFSQRRPFLTYFESWRTEQETNGYYADRIYWFKFEPIKWRVLDENTGLIMCETLIDSQPYSNTIYEKSGAGYAYKYFSDASYTTYASNYEKSSIRAWLNADFYKTAFTSAEQSKIVTTTLSNKSFLTLLGYNGYGQFDSNDTNDKIFLLSYDEMSKTNYGFSSDATRKAQGSDYAKCQGLEVSTDSSSEWYLRTPSDYSDQTAYVGCGGNVSGRGKATCNASAGIRPALRLDLTSVHKWTHTQKKISCIDNSGSIEHWYCETCKTYIVKNEKGEYVKTTKDALTAKATPAVKDGNYIYFGSYPQSKVTDSSTISALNEKAPSWDSWTSYGYYSGDGNYGSMTQGDWMRYTDVTYNGEKYRGVKFTQYRPYQTCYTSLSTYQDDNGYSTNTVYWFKFEPLKWCVLDGVTGLIMCEILIDAQPYSNTIYKNGSASEPYQYFNDTFYTNYASDYKSSSIRAWLNDEFYSTAFTSEDKSAIATTTLNNDGYYTLRGTTGYEKLDSNDTNDKIFLLSYDEVSKTNYGFDSTPGVPDTARSAKSSDYAKCQGLDVSTSSSYEGNSRWFLRSPGEDTKYCCEVHYYSYAEGFGTVNGAYNGVRPALRLDQASIHFWTHNDAKTATSCTNDGNVEYWYCKDCDMYLTKDSDGNYVKTDKDKIKIIVSHTFTAETADSKYLKTEANCENAAVYYKSCSGCGLTSQDTANEDTFTSGTANGHAFTAETVDSKYLKSDADCENATTYYKSCLACGLTSKGTANEDTFTSGTANGHAFTAETVDSKYLKSDADCENATTYYKSCLACGLTSKGTDFEDAFTVGEANGHNFGDTVEVKTATCLGDGVKTAYKYCDKCKLYYNATAGDKETLSNGAETTAEFIENAAGHIFTDVSYKAATCLEDGNEAYKYCTACEKYFDTNAETNATNGADTNEAYIIAATGHDFTDIPYHANSCADTGNKAYRLCKNCCKYFDADADIFSEDGAQSNSEYILYRKGHNFGETVEVKAATCTDDGVATAYKYCDRCELYYASTAHDLTALSEGKIDTSSFVASATGHTFTDVLYKAAKCTEPGNEAHKYCSACELYFDTTAEKFDTNGADDNSAYVITATGHDFTGTVKMDADGKDGTHSFACANGCGEYGKVVAHTWDAGEVTTPATHLEEGVKTYTCTCGATYTEPVAKIAEHNHIAGTPVAPTCTEQGYTVYTCECGDSYKADYVDALGHNYVGGTCDSCGEAKPSDCDCMCHKNALVKFIYMIIDVILTLFGSDFDCRCGESHF